MNKVLRMIVTLSERKAARVAQMRLALEELRASLAPYARAHGGRFLIFGSAARGQLKFSSDVDILVDFTGPALPPAWRFAEDECARLRLVPDVLPAPWMSEDFVARVSQGAVTLG